MWCISRTVVRMGLAVAVAVGTLTATAGPVRAADEEYVKYYTVTSSYNGKPENLTEIATRFLGSGSRSAEILNGNTGREQPDGDVLTDGNRLHAGWMLVMPWDAVGAGIQYGVLPPPPRKSPPKKGTPTKDPAPQQSAPPQSIPMPGNPPSAQPGVTLTAPQAGRPPAAPSCPSSSTSSTKSDWARLRMAADKAWPQSKGKGQLVAIVDSGVNGGLAQLSGHVSIGVDVTDDAGRGDSDCLGTGTAMAALLVARQVKGEGPVGVAPEATILPVRVARDKLPVTPEAQVKGIATAVAAGATVIALGSSVDATDAGVARAIADAVARDVVVVLGAPTEDKPVNPDVRAAEGTVRVAGVGIDDQWAVNYRKGAVDVTAPGVNVTSLGSNGPVSGSGTHYAVAFAAGEAALIRSAYPDLTAAQVTHRLKATAERMGDGEPPHSQYGWGFLSPASAVTKVLSEESAATVPSAQEPAPAISQDSGDEGSGSTRTTVLIVTVALMLAAAALLGHRIRQLLRKDDDDAGYENDMDLYDPRLQAREPAMASPGPVSAGPVPRRDPEPVPPPSVNGGPGPGGDHWSDPGGHWTD
ncbi:S8 family serine peptidase [Actinoplanes sp. NPDC051475]|uniref:S8 family serine peptidase n=1 Tax=Actinoplanes sp. NPDC051475 TaxID=3157225 RepID=UPI00344D7026